MQIVPGTDRATFTLKVETEADREFLDAIDHRGAHAITRTACSRVPGQGGYINDSATLLVDRKQPQVLEREAGRQVLRAAREFLSLCLCENALDRHVGAHATDPDAQHKLAAQLDKLQLVLQTFRIAITHPEAVPQEVDSTHIDTPHGCNCAIVAPRAEVGAA
ncbi:hypothetical protein [Acidovorax sp. Leaf160]|uniref:hypothetical protein n=1 Tax=Acidovorax sp. Leaf160 TaxID=1736280 RepID=UPI000AC124BF|nr:hypothetical protein [Acidovorax sp. Leaf160]